MTSKVSNDGARLRVIDPEDRQVQLGRELRELRLPSGMSSRQLARKAHMSQSKLLRFEQGAAVPDLDEAEA